MRAELEVLVLPYASVEGKSLLHRLIMELRDGAWTEFWGAIAFAKTSGNFPDLLDAISSFAGRTGARVTLTFGADVFGNLSKGSDYEAIKELLERLQEHEGARVHLYHERGRTFHPKLYLFADEQQERALLAIGSSNWSEGGLLSNVEANVLIELDLSDSEHKACFDQIVSYFEQYWTEAND